jgi:hypothetical protein
MSGDPGLSPKLGSMHATAGGGKLSGDSCPLSG